MKHMKIMGHDYALVMNPDLQREMATPGACCAGTLKIQIDPGAPESRKEEALLHEIIEALKYHLDLELKHDKLSALSEGLYQVLRDNQLMSSWKERLQA